nr:hypothetical protein [Psychrobacter sp.]
MTLSATQTAIFSISKTKWRTKQSKPFNSKKYAPKAIDERLLPSLNAWFLFMLSI